jgi:hypothetical protein
MESAPLRQVDTWLDRIRTMWEPRLNALATEIVRQAQAPTLGPGITDLVVTGGRMHLELNALSP